MSLRVAVIGGGITGLATAHRLTELARASDDERHELEIIVLEAADHLGGAIRTESIGDYLVEWGADMFITDKPWAAALCERLGLGERLVAPNNQFRRSLVLHDGKPVPVPEGFMLMAPTQLRSMVKTPILSPAGKLRVAAEVLVPRRRGFGDESVASFVRRRMGREALERLVQPLIGGIYTGDPERLSLQATLPRFIEMERAHRSLILGSLDKAAAAKSGAQNASGARYGLFVGLPLGMAELLNALTDRLRERATVRTGVAARSLRQIEEGWRLQTDDEALDLDAVALALPTFRAAELVADLDGALAKALDAIRYASTAIVVSGHRLADIRDRMDAFGLVVPQIESRKVLAVSYASRKFAGRAPEGRILLRTFVGGALQPELAELSDERVEALVEDELARIYGVGGRPDFRQVVRHARAMPQYEVGHLDRVRDIESLTKKHRRLAVAGNAFHGVGIPDSVHSGEQAAERIFRALARPSPPGA